MTATVVGFDPLREGRHLEARAARECADWLAALKIQGKAPRSLQGYAYTVWDLLELFPDKPVDAFTTGDVEQLLARYPAPGLDPRVSHLNSFFRYLRRRRLIDENPMEFLEPRRKRKPKLPDIFTDAEVALMYALPSPDGPLLTIMLEGGLRRQDCLNLQVRFAVLARGELVVRNSKGGKDRIVPMTPLLQAAVVDLTTLEGLNPDDFFWGSRPGGGTVVDHARAISYTTFARWFRNSLAAAGVRYRKPHMTRHTRATQMRRRGYDLDEIQEFLGHESIETTKDLYVHTNVFDLKAKMAVLEPVT